MRTSFSRLKRLRTALGQVLVEHKLVIILTAAYVSLGGLVQLLLGRPWPIALTTKPFAVAWLVGSGLYLTACALFARRSIRDRLSFRSIGSACLVALLVEPVHLTFQSVKQSIGPVLGFPLDPTWSAIDIWIHGGPAWRLLEPLLTPPIIRAFDFIYILWFPGLLMFTVWCCWSTQAVLRRRAVIAWLLLWSVGGTAGAWLAASAGPCYYEHVVSGPENPYGDLLRRLDDQPFTFARFNQVGVWRLGTADVWGPFAGVSAMPSMHVGLAVLVALVAWRRRPEVGIVLGVGALLVQIGSVLLGWHYAIDGYVGAAIAAASWSIAARLVPPPDLGNL